MTVLTNRTAPADSHSGATRTAPAAAGRRESVPAAPARPRGSYTARDERFPAAAVRPKGTYVTSASQHTRPQGTYTLTDGAPRGLDRAAGTYTSRG